MKLLLSASLFLLLSLSASAQSIRQVIGSLGGSTESSGFTLSFTLGEVAVNEQQNSEFFFREGFWFWNPGGTGPTPLGFNKAEALLYPNPTFGELKILKVEGVKAFKVFSATGQLLLQKNIRDDNISLEVLASGIYRVQLLDREGKIIHTQTIFKN